MRRTRARPTKAFNLRLNEYELELIQRVAEQEYCSMQSLMKRILFRELEKMAGNEDR